MTATLHRIHTTPRRADAPQCKRCGHPLAPWQEQTGFCAICWREMCGVSATPDHGPEDFEHYCTPAGFAG